MPLPVGLGIPGPGGNTDFGGLPEALSALQRNPQIRRAFGVGPLNLTGSVFYAIWGTSGGTVSLADNGGTFAVQLPLPLVFDQGIPTVNAVSGGILTVTAGNTSTNMLVLYK